MSLRDLLITQELAKIDTPAYYFDIDKFNQSILQTKNKYKNIPLTFSIKANPFLVGAINDKLEYVEVCSPGELEICIKNKIAPNRIIYSGVNKGYIDVKRAITYGVEIVTAESINHLETEQAVAKEQNIIQKVILRLTSGNQFGMSKECIFNIIDHKQKYPNIDFWGIHYYSGTQKKFRQIKKDVEELSAVLDELKENHSYKPHIVEYGPGLSVDYFDVKSKLADNNTIDETLELITEFAEKYPLGIEMGRFLASDCGIFATRIVDKKTNDGINYLICDGGIHQLKYYGQTMAMQIPQIQVMNKSEGIKQKYCLCGSLCTVADVMVREVELPDVEIGDVLLFFKCGAYSMTESSLMFLSRDLPNVYVYREKHGITQVRKNICTYDFNM